MGANKLEPDLIEFKAPDPPPPLEIGFKILMLGFLGASKDCLDEKFSNVLEFSKTIGYEKLGVQCKESWFNVYNKYDYQEAHDHMGFNISAIYILQGSHKTGTINFKNPSPSKEVHLFNPENEYTFSNMCINPQPGLLLIFDSNLVHSVSQNLTNEKRISLAYNFNVYK